MKRYVLNTLENSNGDHEVHVSSCALLPSYVHQQDLGYHFTCSSAMNAAKAIQDSVNGCYECNRVCHIGEVEV